MHTFLLYLLAYKLADNATRLYLSVPASGSLTDVKKAVYVLPYSRYYLTYYHFKIFLLFLNLRWAIFGDWSQFIELYFGEYLF